MTDCRVVYPRRLEFLLVNSGKTLRADLVEKFRKSFLDLLVCVTFQTFKWRCPVGNWIYKPGIEENLKGVLLVNIIDVTNETQISVDYRNQHLFLALVAYKQQVDYSSALGCGPTMCLIQISSNFGPRLKKQPLSATCHTHGRGQKQEWPN